MANIAKKEKELRMIYKNVDEDIIESFTNSTIGDLMRIRYNEDEVERLYSGEYLAEYGDLEESE